MVLNKQHTITPRSTGQYSARFHGLFFATKFVFIHRLHNLCDGNGYHSHYHALKAFFDYLSDTARSSVRPARLAKVATSSEGSTGLARCTRKPARRARVLSSEPA